MGCSSSNSVQVEENRPTKQPEPTKQHESTKQPEPTKQHESTKQPEPTNKTTNSQSNINANPVQSNQRTISAKSNKQDLKKKYKLNYFDIGGRAELIRILFTIGNVDFEDNRFKNEEWPEIKKTMPLGTVPTLEIQNESMLVQSLAIARYVAKETGLAGKTSLDMAKVDAVLETAKELFDSFVSKVVPQLRNPTEGKDKILNEFIDNEIPKKFNQLLKLLKAYGSDGYFVGNELTIADIYVYVINKNLLNLNASILDDYFGLRKNLRLVEIRLEENNPKNENTLEQNKQN